MKRNLFDIDDLIELIDEAIEPYTLDARHGDVSIPSSLPYSPTDNVEKKIYEQVNLFLENHPTWPLQTFLAFACGLRHREIFTKLGELLIPSNRNNPNEFEKVNIYNGYPFYLMETLSAAEVLINYRRACVFIKTEKKAFYISYLGNSTPIDIDTTRFDKLAKEVGSLDELKSLQKGNLDPILLAKFSELISANYMDRTREEIAKHYREWFELITKQHGVNPRSPVDWLKLIQSDPFLCSTVQVPQYMARLITIRHFGLDEQNALHGLPRGATVDIEQAAKILTMQLGRDIRPQQVLELCAEGHFNAYVNRETYISPREDEQETPIDKRRITKLIHEIEKAIHSNSIDRNYQYYHQGLIRLKRNQYGEIPVLSQQTIDFLRDGGTILTKWRESSSGLRWLQRELSLSEFIFDSSWFITTNAQPITRNDLLFLEQELYGFKKTAPTSESEEPCTTESKNLTDIMHEEVSISKSKSSAELIKESIGTSNGKEFIRKIYAHDSNALALPKGHGENRHFWIYLKNEYAGKKDSPIQEMTSWLSQEKGRITWSNPDFEPISQHTFKNWITEIKKSLKSSL